MKRIESTRYAKQFPERYLSESLRECLSNIPKSIKDENIEPAIEYFYSELQNLCDNPTKEYVREFIQQLSSDFKSKSDCWSFAITMPIKDGSYTGEIALQFCSRKPNYERLLIVCDKEGEIIIDKDTPHVDANPDLSKVKPTIPTKLSKESNQSFSSLLEFKNFCDEVGIYRVAIFGRVGIYTEKHHDQDVIKKGVEFTSHLEKQLNSLLDHLNNQEEDHIIVDGGWAGNIENTRGAPLFAHMFGIVSAAENETCPPVTIIPSFCSFDRVSHRYMDHEYADAKQLENEPQTLFETEGHWGDDSPYVAAFSNAGIVFEPYGLWTEIEMANLVVQNKPFICIANPNDLEPDGKYYEEFKDGRDFVEREFEIGDIKKTFRVYKDLNEKCFLYLMEKTNDKINKSENTPKPITARNSKVIPLVQDEVCFREQ